MANQKPTVKLIGGDGNAFVIIGACSKALKSVSPELAKEFQDKAFACPSYGALLGLAAEYCEVE